MNWANRLTISRLFMAFILLGLLEVNFPYAKSMALLIFIIAGITDYLDGYLARNVYGVTSFGSLMDPVTDKILVCAAFVSFAELGFVKAIVVVIIIAREFAVTGLRLLAMDSGKVISAGKWGKHKTVWQIVAVIVILLGIAIRQDVLIGLGKSTEFLANYDFAFGIIAHVVSVAVAAITVASGWMYLHQHRALFMRHM